MPVIEHDYQITDLRTGDLVQLRWLGDRRVPNREGGSWATVVEVGAEYVRVLNCTYGSNRRITLDHIFRVDKKVGRGMWEPVAKRMQADPRKTDGTRLVTINAS